MWRACEGAEPIAIKCPCCDNNGTLSQPLACPNCRVVVAIEIEYAQHLTATNGALICPHCLSAYPIPRNLSTMNVAAVC